MTTPQTEIGQLLSGKDATHNSIQIQKILDDRIAVVRQRMRSGLTREQYNTFNNELMALYSAMMITKSIHIYNAQ